MLWLCHRPERRKSGLLLDLGSAGAQAPDSGRSHRRRQRGGALCLPSHRREAEEDAMETYDLMIIGGGAGAFAAAIKADELNASAALINDGLPLGGTCVNVGCVPSKTLLRAAEIIWEAQHHAFSGMELALKRFDFSEMIREELRLVEELRREKYEDVLASLPRVTHIPGRARFLDPYTIDVNGRRLSGKTFVIATGSTATVPPIEGLADAGYITHIEALRNAEQPKRLVVLGAGQIGLEFGQLFHRFGTHVTILH